MASYLSRAGVQVRLQQLHVEILKAEKYAHLSRAYLFTPVANETTGVFGLHTAAFLRELGRRIHQETGEARSLVFLLQQLSVAVQRGNAASLFGSSDYAILWYL